MSYPVRTCLLAILVSVTCRPSDLVGQKLSAEEQRIISFVDAHTEEAVGLLEEMVNINSGTLNPQGVRMVGNLIRQPLDEMGFETRWIEMPAEVDRAGHLFAVREGDRGSKLLLIGHLDTVFEPDSPFQRFERSGSVARGPGVNDMKGGNVVMLYALKALYHAGVLDGSAITVAFTGDEENPGDPLEISRGDLIEAARRSDIALEFETGVRDRHREYATVARRSASTWTLQVSGRTAHSSGIFSESSGSGAIYEAARILFAFHEELRGEEYLTFSPGIIAGGTEVTFDEVQDRGTAFGKSNVIPQKVVVKGDIRTLTDEQLQRTRERMRRIVAESLPLTKAEISFTDKYPSMAPTEGNLALLDRLNEINRDLGLPEMDALDPSRRGAADISFVAPYVDGLAGLGVHGSGAHSPEETIDLSTLPTIIKRAALLIHRLTRE